MIKAIKKLFSVDESELDFDEIETSEDKSSLYQRSLEEQRENNKTAELKVREILEDQNNKIKEVEILDISSPNEPKPVTSNSPIKAFDDTTPDVLAHNVVEDDIKSNTRTFDFAKEIEDAYEKPYAKYDEEKKVATNKNNPVKSEASKQEPLVSKDNYVLKDIISPMHGVVRKETNVIKRDEDVKKSQIIKLREQVKTTEIDPSSTDDYAETIEFQFTDTKNLEDTLNSMPSAQPRDTLSETSKFTLIEDSTGEMRLVIDEEE